MIVIGYWLFVNRYLGLAWERCIGVIDGTNSRIIQYWKLKRFHSFNTNNH
jgi:hypothetical protein